MKSRGMDQIRNLPIWPSAPEIEPIPGGRTNDNFRVTCGDRIFFARAGVDIPFHGICREHEIRNVQLASQAGLAPKLLHVIEQVQVSEFVPGKPLIQGQPVGASTLREVAVMLRRLHELPVPQDYHPYDMVRIVRQQLRDLHPGTLSRADLEKLGSILDRAPIQTSQCLIHIDLIPENFIEDGNRLWLVDWEYGGRGDPALDLANLCIGFLLDEAQKEIVIREYGTIDADKVRAFEPLNLVREALWCLSQIQNVGIQGDLKEYTEKCLNRLGIGQGL